MESSLRRAGTFIGCYIGCAAVGTVFITAVVNHFAPVSVETTAYISELSVLAAVIPASLITKRLNRIFAKRAALRLLEREWERWMSQQCARKSDCTAKLNASDRDAPEQTLNSMYCARFPSHHNIALPRIIAW